MQIKNSDDEDICCEISKNMNCHEISQFNNKLKVWRETLKKEKEVKHDLISKINRALNSN